ncbi:MAG TPA: class F sortase [Candidatus Nitrosocosmicus sp.]|nr:class F sortase [Candidatus Nitrosocosmicus sp.]
MSKLNIFLLLTVICLLIFANTNASGAVSIEKNSAPSITNTPTPSPTPTPIAGLPKKLIIPKIQVDTELEYMGVDPDGAMQVPQDWNKAGWFSGGIRPGEIGKAAIDGHFDTDTGMPAVFWNLGQLNPGDEIKILDDRNKIYTFIVQTKQNHEYDKFPLNELIGKSNKKELNIVTCTGYWNFETNNYSHRMLITTELSKVENIQSSSPSY